MKTRKRAMCELSEFEKRIVGIVKKPMLRDFNTSLKFMGVYTQCSPKQAVKALQPYTKIGNRLVERNAKHTDSSHRKKRVKDGFVFIGWTTPIVSSEKEVSKVVRLNTETQNYAIKMRDPLTGKVIGSVKGRFLNGNNR